MNARHSLFLFIVFLSFSLAACTPSRPGMSNAEPLDLLWQKSSTQSETLIVFLPGVRDSKEDFLKNKMFSELAETAPGVDMLAADLHLEYLKKGTNVKRLREDIIEPAKKKGYKSIWLVGISLGGLSSLLYMKSHPKDICGIVLLSPYLGEKSISDEIASAGSVKQWQVPDNQKLNDEHALWAWLKVASLDKVYLGSGNKDRFLPLQQQLAHLLPEDNVHFVHGKHRWPVWRELWKYFVMQMQTENLFEQCQST